LPSEPRKLEIASKRTNPETVKGCATSPSAAESRDWAKTNGKRDQSKQSIGDHLYSQNILTDIVARGQDRSE